MLLRLPRNLHYPITVTELLKQPNDNVERFAPLFNYFFKTTVTEGDELGNEHQVEKTFPTRFESTVEGVLKSWRIKKGLVIREPCLDIAEIEEPCDHGVQFGGMCANCGKDMTQVSYNTDQTDAGRATINMVHDNVSLTVSQNEAARVEDEAKRRLLASQKLSLVVDLDQTIIHATVDPTVPEWQKDESNPNHEAVKDVRAFQLVDDGPGARGCWYYIKLRPGLKVFLEKVSRIYELHIYTMGTRAYAQNIASIIDPDRKIFGDRILSRDESGSLVAKSLQRLFPVDTKMVVIIDDRGDVWKWNENLIKVTPYDFFVGIGDINSSFLPKKPTINTLAKAAVIAAPDSNQDLPDGAPREPDPQINGGSANHQNQFRASPGPDESAKQHISALDQLASMRGGNDPTMLQAQSNEQDETVAAQIQDRPLLQQQKQLEAQGVAIEESNGNGNSDDKISSEEVSSDSDTTKPRHNLLRDNDKELEYLEQSLRSIHTEFFEIYHRNQTNAHDGRIAELRSAQISRRKKPALSENDILSLVPDIKDVMPQLKRRVLGGVVVVFSGVLPLGTDVQNCDLGLWAKNFGVKIETKVGKRTTHVIAANNKTKKVKQALSRGPDRIKIVTTQWLMDSIIQWRHMDETDYLLKIDDTYKVWNASGEDDVLSESEDEPTEIETDPEDEATNAMTTGRKLPGLSIKTSPADLDFDDDDLDSLIPGEMEDQYSPIGGTKDDWHEVHDELADFLGSDDEDSDADSVGSLSSDRSSLGGRSSRKRRRGGGDNDDDDAESVALFRPKKKTTFEGLTSLSQSEVVSSSESSLRTPEMTVQKEDGRYGEDREDEDDEDDEDEVESVGSGNSGLDEAIKDLEAEMERAASEEDQWGKEPVRGKEMEDDQG